MSSVRIKLSSTDTKELKEICSQITDIAERMKVAVKGPVPLPTEISKFTVNRSTFVHKEARDQFAMRVHQRLIDIYEPKAKTISDLMSLALPGGVDIEIKM